jgi:hypothetical protein
VNGTTEHLQVTLPATNRRGKSIMCHVSVAPLRRDDHNIRGAILLMEEAAAGSARESDS